MLIRFSLIVLLSTGLMACGNQSDPTTPISEQARSRMDEAVDQSSESAETATGVASERANEHVDDMRYPEQHRAAKMDAMSAGAHDAVDQAQSRVARAWGEAMALSEQARDQAAAALEAARSGDAEAIESARAAAHVAMFQANAAWEDAREHTGPAWAQMRESARTKREHAQVLWNQVDELVGEHDP